MAQVAALPSDSSPLAMGAGSSKRVHPEAAFHAADTDKDGKLTPQELGAIRDSCERYARPSSTQL